jgi:hypothetical protein
MTWQQLRAAEITLAFWGSRRRAMVAWLISAKKFSPKGAESAVNSFIETMVYVAGEVGEPQLRQPART